MTHDLCLKGSWWPKAQTCAVFSKFFKKNLTNIHTGMYNYAFH
jgi:hypothetical protein